MRKFNSEVKVVNRIDDIYTKTNYELSKNGKQINIKSLGKKNYDLSKRYGSEPRRIIP